MLVFVQIKPISRGDTPATVEDMPSTGRDFPKLQLALVPALLINKNPLRCWFGGRLANNLEEGNLVPELAILTKVVQKGGGGFGGKLFSIPGRVLDPLNCQGEQF